MPEDKYRTGPGSRLIVRISKEVGGQQGEPAEGGGGQGGAEEGFFGAPRLSRDIYPPPPDTEFHFFDLGVHRPTNDDEWAYSLKILDGPEEQEPLIAAWNDALLAGLDPWPKFLPLEAKAENLLVDIIFSREGHDDLHYIVGKGERAYLTDYNASGDSDSVPVRENKEWANDDHLEPVLKGGTWSARIESGWYYNSFDTGAGVGFNYKITTDPDPAAEAKSLTFRRGDVVEVYLTPKMGQWGLTAKARLPVLPSPSAYSSSAHNLAQFAIPDNISVLRGSPPQAVWDELFAFFREGGVSEEEWPSDINGTELRDAAWYIGGVLASGEDVASAPLCAVVRREDKTYYVWGVMRYGEHDDPGGSTVAPFPLAILTNPSA